jgi:CRP-like cAMP-binding protein
MSDLLKANITKRTSITEEEWKGILNVMKPKTIRKKELLLQAGDICEYNCFILKGCLRTYFTDEKDHEHIFQIGFEDWWASDLSSFVTGEPAYFSIEALEDTEMLIMQGAYVASQRRMIDSMSYNAERRYTNLIKKYPFMEMRVAQHHIASYLGITPEALSRIKRGIIEKSRTNS